MTLLKERFIRSCYYNHRCCWCGSMVLAKSRAYYQVAEMDGDFLTNYFHMECYHAYIEYFKINRGEDSYEFEMFSRGRTDSKKLQPEFNEEGEKINV